MLIRKSPGLCLFQFHCWSDLYGPHRKQHNLPRSVSIPLLVWFIHFKRKMNAICSSLFQFHCWSDLYYFLVFKIMPVIGVSIPLLVWFIQVYPPRVICTGIVSIPLLVWFIQIWDCWPKPAINCFNSTVGLIYTLHEISMVREQMSFQFHCWSDLYGQGCLCF